MKKFMGAVGLSVTLVAALVTLFAGLAALLLANSLRGQLQETQGQLEEVQGKLEDAQSKLQKMQQVRERQQEITKGDTEPAGRAPGEVKNNPPPNNTKDRSQDSKSLMREGQDQQRALLIRMQEDGDSPLLYLLLLALGLVILASFVLVVISALNLRFEGFRLGRSRGQSGTLTPSHTETSNIELASPLEDGRWMKLVEECVEVVDELDSHMDSFDETRREVAGHVILRFEEILGRSGVEIISNDAIFDRVRHKPDANHAATHDGAVVRETLSPGFAVGPRVLRRARVRLE